jgi:type I restriction enzyme, S subunit
MDDRKLLSPLYSGLRNTIPTERLMSTKTPQPPKEEQAAIVRFLGWVNGRLDRAVREKRKVIALLNEQKQAIIHHAITRGPDPSVPLKCSDIPWLNEIPVHWEIVPLKFLCRRIQNGATPPSSEQQYFEEGTIPWFGPSSIGIASELGTPVRHLTSKAFSEGKARLVKGPAILIIVIGATAGKMGLLVGEGATNQQITAFELKNDKMIPHFGFQQLKGSEKWLRSTASTATIPILDSGIVSRLPVAFPPKEEQEAILSAIAQRTKPQSIAISRLEREIVLLSEYRIRLIADVVTGELDVREAAAALTDEPTPDVSDVVDDLMIDPETAEEELAG